MPPDQSIDVYGIPLPDDARDLDERFSLLSADEKKRAAKFKFERDRNRWINSRAALRMILARYTNVAAKQIAFTLRPDGKPVLSNGQTRLDTSLLEQKKPPSSIHFNLSHSGNRALIAVSKLDEIGCDIEHVKRIRDWPIVTRRFFSSVEQEELAKVETDQKTHAFYLCWTRKEAVIKTTGEGLRANLSAFDVSLTPGKKAEVYADRRSDPTDLPWQLIHIDAGSDYVGAVATRAANRPAMRMHSGWKVIST